MTRALERTELEAELAAAERMLADLPRSFVLERAGIQDRVEELRGRLATLANRPARKGEAALYFGGNPVFGTRGIDAAFGGNSISKFQGVVSSMRSAGDAESPIGGLLVTGVLHGSFGFQLEERGDEPLLAETALAAAIDAAVDLLRATKFAEEAAFDELLEIKGQKAHSALRAFLGHLAENGASVRVVAHQERIEFDPMEVLRAAERVSATELHEDLATVECVFGGELSFSRSFELRTVPENKVVKGQLAPEVPAEALDAWHHQRCRAVIRTVTRVKGEQRKLRHFLLRLEPPTSE